MVDKSMTDDGAEFLGNIWINSAATGRSFRSDPALIAKFRTAKPVDIIIVPCISKDDRLRRSPGFPHLRLSYLYSFLLRKTAERLKVRRLLGYGLCLASIMRRRV
jgi:hypothetical protein